MFETFNTVTAMVCSYHGRISPLRNTNLILSKCVKTFVCQRSEAS